LAILRAACTICRDFWLQATFSGTGIEVDAPIHSTSEAQRIGELPFQFERLFVIIADPLIIPSYLHHHRIGIQSWCNALLFHEELVDLGQRHNPIRASAAGFLASSDEFASYGVASGVSESVSSTIVLGGVNQQRLNRNGQENRS